MATQTDSRREGESAGSQGDELQSLVGTRAEPRRAIDPVNRTMIRQWCEAMDDHNPVYRDPAAAERSIHGGLVAPPAMLDAWMMIGQAPRSLQGGQSSPLGAVLPRLDEAGFVGVVATNAEHEYERYLRPGDELTAHETLEAVSPEKKTGLGTGHFVTTVTEYRDADDRTVGRMRWSILKFRPNVGAGAAAAGLAAGGERPPRPRPAISRDTQFFWDGLAAGELRIQRCKGCGELHHPPVVRCPACGHYELGHRVASGRGTIYSAVEVHHPQYPAFDYPLPVALIELEEGTRLVAGLSGLTPEEATIGRKVEVAFEEVEPGLTLPVFRPARPAFRESPLERGDLSEGMELEPCAIPITRTLIIAGAVATRDYTEVHHDPVIARRQGTPDIFMNILTTNGLCTRYVTDWAGPTARLKRIQVRLGVPNFPDDVMTFRGRVERVEAVEGGTRVEVSLRGTNRLGDHAKASVELVLDEGASR